MSSSKLPIDARIESAETLPGSFYRDQAAFDQIKEKVFYQNWQWVGDEHKIKTAKQVHPFVLLDGFLSEPMLLSKDEQGQIHCLCNVCTHRGNLVVQGAGSFRSLVCNYHGRKFGLDGAFKSMPEFSAAEDFPRPCDSLHAFELAQWGPLLLPKWAATWILIRSSKK